MANRQTLKLLIALGTLVLALVMGTVAYAVFRPPAEASGPIEAIPLAQIDTAPSGGAVAAEGWKARLPRRSSALISVSPSPRFGRSQA